MNGPAAVVKKLYLEVIARRPLGVPKGEDKTAIWPLLSPRLRSQLTTAQACENDYFRQYPPGDEKPDFPWLEQGLFSGWVEQAVVHEADVVRTESHPDGRFRVSLRFTYRDELAYKRPYPPGPPFYWYGIAEVVNVRDRFLVDDVVIFDDAPPKVLFRLSEAFSGCEGGLWVGSEP